MMTIMRIAYIVEANNKRYETKSNKKKDEANSKNWGGLQICTTRK